MPNRLKNVLPTYDDFLLKVWNPLINENAYEEIRDVNGVVVSPGRRMPIFLDIDKVDDEGMYVSSYTSQDIWNNLFNMYKFDDIIVLKRPEAHDITKEEALSSFYNALQAAIFDWLPWIYQRSFSIKTEYLNADRYINPKSRTTKNIDPETNFLTQYSGDEQNVTETTGTGKVSTDEGTGAYVNKSANRIIDMSQKEVRDENYIEGLKMLLKTEMRNFLKEFVIKPDFQQMFSNRRIYGK